MIGDKRDNQSLLMNFYSIGELLLRAISCFIPGADSISQITYFQGYWVLSPLLLLLLAFAKAIISPFVISCICKQINLSMNTSNTLLIADSIWILPITIFQNMTGQKHCPERDCTSCPGRGMTHMVHIHYSVFGRQSRNLICLVPFSLYHKMLENKLEI